MKRWEYKTYSADLDRHATSSKDRDARLSALGKEGWELVSVVPSGGDYYSFSWIFKREVLVQPGGRHAEIAGMSVPIRTEL